MIKKIDTLILGGGLTGIAFAVRMGEVLPDEEILIVEKSQFPGGLCRSKIKDGFTYDYSGHLLHLRREETRGWVFDLLKNNLREVKRDARIFSEGRLTRYPYQMNLWGLPLPTIKECVSGVVEAHIRDNRPDPSGSFLKWSKDIFGDGITKHFMKPYNEKLFQMSSVKFNAEWCGGFVPRPSVEETILGALTDNSRRLVGYNATFFYPEKGGIQSLVDALLNEAVKRASIRLAVWPEKIDLSSQKITLSDGTMVKFKRLVSTIPLADFASLCGMKKVSKTLRATPIVCFNIGIKGGAGHRIHWIYFPEGKFNFYRVGFYSNINPASAPKGFYSMYVEVSLPSENYEKSIDLTFENTVSGLLRAGLIPSKNSIASLDIRRMPCAYVVYDFKRARALEDIKLAIKKSSPREIYLAGRYGAWKYSYMEESLWEAIRTSQEIKSKHQSLPLR